jgi:hypothetical protein
VSADPPNEIIADLGLLAPAGAPEAPRARREWTIKSRWRRLRSAGAPLPVVVLVILAGLSLGAAVTYQVGSQLHRGDATIALVLLIDPAGPRGVSQEAEGHVEWEQRVHVINAGSGPVDVSKLRATSNGLSMRGGPTAQRLEPGATEWVSMGATVDCSSGPPPRAVTIDLEVRTSNGETHPASYAVSFAGTALDDFLGRSCGMDTGGMMIHVEPN